MNYLVHLYLAEPTPECLLGTLMGDFVKGRLDERYPPEVRWGIELHRRVDSFAHGNAAFRRSLRRLADRFGYFKPILIDVFYDHFLARDWPRHADTPLEEFAAEVYRVLAAPTVPLPEGLAAVAPRMIAGDWLVSYRDPDTIALVLERISRRLRRPNPLAAGIDELYRHYRELEEDCDEFLAQAQEYVKELQRQRVESG